MQPTLFLHKDCINSPLAQNLKIANPVSKVISITKNTQVTNPDYNLISLNPKD